MRSAISELLDIARSAGMIEKTIEIQLMQWCRRYVNEFSVMSYADKATQHNKGYAEHLEEAQLHKMTAEIVRQGSERIAEKDERGITIRRRITIIHDKESK